MHCRNVAALLLFAAAALAQAAPEDTRVQIAARLQQQVRDLPAETEDALAPAVADAGKKLWNRKFRDGKSLANCFPNGGRRVAGNYPQYDSRLKRVVTLEMAINQCLKAHGEAVLEPLDPDTMGAALAYVRSLSNGQKIAVRVPAAAQERFEQGRRLYFSRLGQRNFACASCHVQAAGKRYADIALSPVPGQATHWPVIRDGKLVTMQMRIRECLELMGAAPFAAGSDELNHLEYFLAYLSNGMPLKANVSRPR